MKKVIVYVLLIAMFTTMLTGCFHSHTPGNWETVRKATASRNGLMQKKCTECGEVVEEKEYERTKDEAIEEAQLDALERAKSSLKGKLKDPSSLVINNVKFYYGEYDEETKTMTYAAIKLDYTAKNGFGGSVRDEYVKLLVSESSLTAEQLMQIYVGNLG